MCQLSASVNGCGACGDARRNRGRGKEKAPLSLVQFFLGHGGSCEAQKTAILTIG
jgi:hypothetical protein